MYIDRDSCLYILLTEINPELNNFLYTGRTDCKEFHALPTTKEEELKNECKQLGYEIRYYRHSLEYMDETVTIKYLKVRNPDNDVSISLIPWFVVPGRPYPIFIYIYAIWYYYHHGKKSMNEAARASGKLFKISSFHKSTVSRSIGTMKNIIDLSQIDGTLALGSRDISCDISNTKYPNEDAVEMVKYILKTCPAIESLKEEYLNAIKPLPETINAKPTIKHVLNDIPSKYSHIIIHPESTKRNSRDARKRLPRPRNKKTDPMQRRFRFVEYARREDIRKEFIEICLHLVLDAAIKYHCFLI